MTDTLVSALDAVPVDADRGFVFVDEAGNETYLSMLDVVGASDGVGDALRDHGLGAGDRIGILTTEPRDFLLSFFGSIRQGAIAVPLPPPLPATSIDVYIEQVSSMLAKSGARLLLVEPRLVGLAETFLEKVADLQQVLSATEIVQRGVDAGQGSPHKVAPSDLAFLQFTSGSTGMPRGVCVSHESVLANARAILREGLRTTPEDVGVSWLPLYHDMGLIGFGIGTALLGAKAVLIPPLSFLRRPFVWLDAVTKHRATITFAPNFALSVIARRAGEDELARWDLSTLRALGCGAEPIRGDGVRRFEELVGRRCGLRTEAFLPCYGMAEATLAITFDPIDQRWQRRRVDSVEMARSGVVGQPSGDDAAPVEVVSCGRTFRDHEVQIRDADGRRLPPDREGEIWFRGPSVTQGYWRDPEATEKTFSEGWLKTGDLGWLGEEGDLYVSGRLKDLIIVHGRNHHPHEIERSAETVEGVRPGGVVAFSVPGASAEQLIVCVEVAEPSSDRVAEVRRAVRRATGLAASEVIQLPKGTLPKTSSGKIRRRTAKGAYLAGDWTRKEGADSVER